jgi:hypothetical protein
MATIKAYEDKSNAKIEQWKAKMAELKAKLKETSADGKISIQNEIEKIQEKLSS